QDDQPRPPPARAPPEPAQARHPFPHPGRGGRPPDQGRRLTDSAPENDDVRPNHPGTRLGVYVHHAYPLIHTTHGDQISVARAFLLFACEVGTHFDETVLFGRAVRSETPADYVLPSTVELVELPHYSKLDKLGQVARASVGTATSMWRGLQKVDVVWVLGPHPLSPILLPLAFAPPRRIVLRGPPNTMGHYPAPLPPQHRKTAP